VTIEGHTDSIGSESYNQRLSERRALAVKHYLVSRGVAGDRLDTVGYGESRPVAPNKTPDGKDNPEGRAMNRRAELKVQ
jgi:OmpA-OmpF porin, OOP family